MMFLIKSPDVNTGRVADPNHDFFAQIRQHTRTAIIERGSGHVKVQGHSRLGQTQTLLVAIPQRETISKRFLIIFEIVRSPGRFESHLQVISQSLKQ